MAALVILPGRLAAQAGDVSPQDSPKPVRTPADTTRNRALLTRNDLLFTAGFAAGTVLVSQLDTRVAARLQDTARVPLLGKRATSLFNSVGVPGSFLLSGAMYFAGRAVGARGLADAGLHTGEAVVIATAATFVFKLGFGRERPSSAGTDDPDDFSFGGGFRGNRFSSFPSGHATAAFAAASAATAEISSRWPRATIVAAPVLYGTAVMVSWARLQSNAHWLSDVFMGAGLGTLVGIKVVRYNHKHPNNAVDRLLLGAMPRVTPYVAGNGVLLSWTIQPGFLSRSPW